MCQFNVQWMFLILLHLVGKTAYLNLTPGYKMSDSEWEVYFKIFLGELEWHERMRMPDHRTSFCVLLTWHSQFLRCSARANRNIQSRFCVFLTLFLILVSNSIDAKELIKACAVLSKHHAPSCSTYMTTHYARYVRKSECHVVYSHLPSGMIIKTRVMALFWWGSNFITAASTQEIIQISRVEHALG